MAVGQVAERARHDVVARYQEGHEEQGELGIQFAGFAHHLGQRPGLAEDFGRNENGQSHDDAGEEAFLLRGHGSAFSGRGRG